MTTSEQTPEQMCEELRKLHEWKRAVLGFLTDQETRADAHRRRVLLNAGLELVEFSFHDRPTLPPPELEEASLADLKEQSRP
jgi:hypothetical protein